MSNPFTNLRIQPSYALYTAVVAWDTPTECVTGKYFVYRSSSGLPKTWTLLNEYAPVMHGVSHWDDTDVNMPTPTGTWFYRLYYEDVNGKGQDSQIIDTWSVLPREQYGLVRLSIWEEYMQMRHGGGIPIAHCVPISSGKLAPYIDPETMQPTSIGCPGDNCFSMIYEGGFTGPIYTWAKILTQDTYTPDMEDGTGVDFKHDITFRMLAFPRPSKNHMIVNPRTDERWMVGERSKPYMFRGVVPVAWTVPCVRITNEDRRHEFPVPYDSKNWP